MIIAVVCSILIHAAVLSLLVFTKLPPPPPKNNQESKLNNLRIEILSKNSYTASNVSADIDKYGKKVFKRDEVICANKDNTYLGVGLMIQPGTDRIVSAPKQYPAYIAGMRVGDFIVDPFSTKVVDGYIDFDVRRGIQILQFHVKAKNICYKTPD